MVKGKFFFSLGSQKALWSPFPIYMLTLFDALAVFAPYWAIKWGLGLGWTGPEVSEQMTSVPIPLIGKATKWRQRYSGFYERSMWMPLKMQEWCALWWLRPTRATIEALGIFPFLDNDQEPITLQWRNHWLSRQRAVTAHSWRCHPGRGYYMCRKERWVVEGLRGGAF